MLKKQIENGQLKVFCISDVTEQKKTLKGNNSQTFIVQTMSVNFLAN